MYRLIRPLLFRLDPERSHRLALRAAALAERKPGIARTFFESSAPTLRQTLFGVDFPNPVGLAAGFDKNAEHVAAWGSLGFGFAEVGSVTARPSAGNPTPRAFRLPDDRALINRMGLPGEGAEAVARRLETLDTHQRSIPIGINVAKTHDPEIVGEAALEDFVEAVTVLAPHADYLALNVSCPNTADGRTFEEPEALAELLAQAISAAGDVPVLIKISPPPIGPGGIFDLGRFDEIAAVALDRGAAGFVATNTASDRVNLATDPSRLARIGAGGLSGAPLRERARAAVRRLYHVADGRVPIIAVGGIDSAEEAYARLRAGASLVQVYTGLVYEGPGLVRRINRGLLKLLKRDGFEHLSEAVGADHAAIS